VYRSYFPADAYVKTRADLRQWRGERYDDTSSRTGPLWPRKKNQK